MPEPTSDQATLTRMFEIMARVVAADERLRKAIGTGELMCVYYPPRGQEAIAAGIGAAVTRDDRLVTTYRSLHELVAKGVPLGEIFAEMIGRSTGASKGKGGPMHIADPDSGTMLSTGIVGAGIPVGVGVALAAQARGDDTVTVTTFGDGANNTGAFHESLNLASVWQLPLVFVCQNNQYAEMTPFHETQRTERISDRATAYAMPGVHVDGNDPVAVHEAVDEAVTRARSGGGPTLIEGLTYRFWGHYFGDQMGYMPADELEAARRDDPFARYRTWLLDNGHAGEEELSGIEERARDEVEAAVREAMEAPAASAESLYEDVYADRTGIPAR